MKVRVRFLDGEVMDGESDAATLERMGFPVSFPDGNNQIAWVSLAAIKYVKFVGGVFEAGAQEDPRQGQGMVKVVMHFSDGETLRSYKDDTFSQEGEGFNLRIWDPETHSLYRTIVSLHALKAIFFVHEWDSRSDAERAQFQAEASPARQPAPAPASAAGPDRQSQLRQSAQQQVQAMTTEETQPPTA
jgi:hypothetical protein